MSCKTAEAKESEHISSKLYDKEIIHPCFLHTLQHVHCWSYATAAIACSILAEGPYQIFMQLQLLNAFRL